MTENDTARRSWQQSDTLTPNAWAQRNLAALAHQQKRFAEAADLWLKALQLQPALPALVIETLQALLDTQRSDAIPALIAELPATMKSYGRCRLLEARAALANNDIETAATILRDLEVPDLRECEVSLSDMWYELQTRRVAQRDQIPVDESLRTRIRTEYPIPYQLNFSMTG